MRLPNRLRRQQPATDARRRWEGQTPSEIEFWKAWVRLEGWHWKDEFRERLDPNAAISDALLRSCVERVDREPVEILDVGAGPVTSVGTYFEDKQLHVTAADPLAAEYQHILADAGLTPPTPTIECHGEELLARFGPSKFDVAYARNSIDHSYDPAAVIRNMCAVVRPGGFVVMRHLRNEGESESYDGLHQWNFDLQNGEAVLWRPRSRTSIRELLAPQDSLSSVEDDGWLVLIVERGPGDWSLEIEDPMSDAAG